jgi:hypothetical protein
MSCGEAMFGKCEICGKEAILERTTFHYGIKCECHSPNHFVAINHCKDCVPEEPKEIHVTLSTQKVRRMK